MQGSTNTGACLDSGVIRAGGKFEVRGAEGNASYSLLVRRLCLHNNHNCNNNNVQAFQLIVGQVPTSCA